MGADLALESMYFKPRPNKGEWDGDELVILRDQFYHGYTVLWRGPVTKDNESLIKVMLPGGIPPKPVKRTDAQFLEDTAEYLEQASKDVPKETLERIRQIAKKLQ